MATTESEAKQKWCPFARTGAFTDRGPMMAIALNRDPREEVSGACLCIASACMAWRWHVARTDKPRETWNGYCGLAGDL